MSKILWEEGELQGNDNAANYKDQGHRDESVLGEHLRIESHPVRLHNGDEHDPGKCTKDGEVGADVGPEDQPQRPGLLNLEAGERGLLKDHGPKNGHGLVINCQRKERKNEPR